MLSVANRVAAMCLTGALLLSQSAAAVFLDFRDHFYSSALGQNAFSTTVDGISFTVKAKLDAELWWDGTDGFGIQHNYENDEIEADETLVILFHTPVTLNGVFITDLFNEYGYLERGIFSTNSDWQKFHADENQLLGNSNGELWIDMDYFNTEFMRFQAPGRKHPGEHHEYALGGLEVTAVPVPAALWLFGSGLIALAGLVRHQVNIKAS